MTSLNNAPVLVVGAGIMGAGIAQVAAQAGHPVFLFDMREGAAAQAKAKLAATLDGLVAKGKITAEAEAATLARIEPIPSLDAAAGAALVVEAIVENLDAKRSLFRQLESVVGEAAILASNTSSISVTAIANGLLHPERFVGMHFFNPVPQMKLVEVVSGLQTDAAVAQAIEALSVAWGKVPVHARSTPGFIVNRIARPYYAETLALLQEQAATPQRLDACLKAAGFRMGPCELMDLIGHDTNFAVTNSVFEANFGDKRYVPSLVQRELVDGGLLGRKSGRGFYTYPEGAPALPAAVHEAPMVTGPVTVHGDGEIADRLEQLVIQGRLSGDAAPSRQRQSAWVGLDIGGARLVLTDGRTAGDIAAREGIADVAVFDRPLLWPAAPGGTLAYAVAPQASAAWRRQAPAWLAALGFVPVPLADVPGLVVARTIAMLINEATDAVQQGVCTPEGADAAMKLGVNYPAGPFEWLARWSVAGVTQVLEALDVHYRGERYRISPWLRRQRA
ncbi:MAG: 3-hydroxyacyl-CoA dehydrogenase [Gammaproteobacteria bacterium]|uniref:3-hydroxyacyl-CoA dehydrogenase n=1 Tax=Hydrogenophaga sp. TaxID=1904254 RepID=UPI0025C71A56|nr:3-hydroxyacyl-CoA dehydrogenase [Hydrogenophaga sp.]MBU4183194.1 3-hydroxyacyl-CoA dehydrogenase [Gammaproteobacteria bacterium]MBU4280362.1 3-hydroxyacyl-CoA dehydrogenase [Gammaproteobacteria bacterium]MBU4505064.1 3-hydroxyacyl-CoA dehydrogenase [Gammaproteobacteria bacterium]MCG2656879.1 3-hydroxyacyl-CoA dehydrogenase [Hydrogenophaga sp.]